MRGGVLSRSCHVPLSFTSPFSHAVMPLRSRAYVFRLAVMLSHTHPAPLHTGIPFTTNFSRHLRKRRTLSHCQIIACLQSPVFSRFFSVIVVSVLDLACSRYLLLASRFWILFAVCFPAGFDLSLRFTFTSLLSPLLDYSHR